MNIANQKLKTLYEQDGHQWYFKNADLLRKGKVKEADLENIAEELESMGRGERRELVSYLTQLFLHLLKWKYQPAMRTGSWESSIHIHRTHSNRQISENPSLKGHMEKIATNAYNDARFEAQKETGLLLATFPNEMPFTLEEALQEDWLPA